MSSSRIGAGRETLGTRLRELRVEGGLSGVVLAGRLGWAQSKVSRIETGRQLPTEEDIKSWVAATAPEPHVVNDLLGQLQLMHTEHLAWRRVGTAAGRYGRRRSLLNLAARATLIRSFEVGVVPELLQTADYARYRLAERVELHDLPADELTEAVLLRIRWQQVLYDSSKRFTFLMMEPVLRTLLCPAEVMRGQLDRLAGLIGMGNVELGIVPTGVRMPIAPLHGFAIFDDFVIQETWGGQQTARAIPDTGRFNCIFERLHRVARRGEDARELIRDALEALPSSSE